MLCAAPIGWDDRGHLLFAEARADDQRLEDDDQDVEDDLEVKDDGSSRLADFSGKRHLEEMRPLSSDEEKSLLGNWGDAEDEDGD